MQEILNSNPTLKYRNVQSLKKNTLLPSIRNIDKLIIFHRQYFVIVKTIKLFVIVKYKLGLGVQKRVQYLNNLEKEKLLID
jgi:hypothetical protein